MSPGSFGCGCPLQALCRVCRSLPFSATSIYVASLLPTLLLPPLTRFMRHSDRAVQHHSLATLYVMARRVQACAASAPSSAAYAALLQALWSAAYQLIPFWSVESTHHTSAGVSGGAAHSHSQLLQWKAECKVAVAVLTAITELALSVDASATHQRLQSSECGVLLSSTAQALLQPQLPGAAAQALVQWMRAAWNGAAATAKNPFVQVLQATLQQLNVPIAQRRSVSLSHSPFIFHPFC
jgi:hypothetical protein